MCAWKRAQRQTKNKCAGNRKPSCQLMDKAHVCENMGFCRIEYGAQRRGIVTWAMLDCNLNVRYSGCVQETRGRNLVSTLDRSVWKTRSCMMKSCVHQGIWGEAPNKLGMCTVGVQMHCLLLFVGLFAIAIRMLLKSIVIEVSGNTVLIRNNPHDTLKKNQLT